MSGTRARGMPGSPPRRRQPRPRAGERWWADQGPPAEGARAGVDGWPDLDLRQLAVLRAIERTGSLAGAARSLGVSTPTCAHHLEALEAIAGARLVERGPRGAHLTDIGAVLAGHAEAIMERAGAARAEVRALADAGVATLRVGTFSSAGSTLLPPAIARVRERTGVRIHLLEAETPDLLAAIADGSVHVAIVHTESEEPLELPAGWTATELLRDPYLIAVPRGHPALGGGPLRLGDLAEADWILSRPETASAAGAADRALLNAAAQRGFEPRVALRTDDLEVACGFVAAGLGVTPLPRLVGTAHPGIELARLADADIGRRILVVHPLDPPPAVSLLVEALAEEADRIDGAG